MKRTQVKTVFSDSLQGSVAPQEEKAGASCSRIKVSRRSDISEGDLKPEVFQLPVFLNTGKR